MANRFRADVIMLIRHPAAFVSSLKRKHWQFPFSNFLSQPQLMENLPPSLQQEIEAYAHSQVDIVDQAILLWKVCHSHIRQCQACYPEWMFVRHEDLSSDPLAGFGQLYDRLNLDLTPAIAAVILEHSSSSNPREAENNATHVLKRNSQENIKNWQNRLTPAEVDHIREQVEPIAKAFYSDADW
ncbi:MAG: sulfotransferase domain-containing protein [Cyanobacteria bacterium J06638_6]